MPVCGRLEGSTTKNGLYEGSDRGDWALEKANIHFEPTQTGSGTAPPR